MIPKSSFFNSDIVSEDTKSNESVWVRDRKHTIESYIGNGIWCHFGGTEPTRGDDSVLFNVVGVVSALLSTINLISYQALWYIFRFPPSLYGVFLIVFDASQILAIPVVMGLTDSFSKCSKMVAVLVSLIALGTFGQVWIFLVYYEFPSEGYVPLLWLFVCRVLQGFGSCVAIVGAICMYQMPSTNASIARFHAYRNSQLDARYWWSPLFLNFLFFALPSSPRSNSSTLHKLFNYFTSLQWIVVIAFVAVVIISLRSNSNPTNITTVLQPFRISSMLSVTLRSPVTLQLFLLHCALDFVFNFCIWGFYWNLFAIAVGKYHILNHIFDVWKVLLPIGLGGIVGAIFNFDRLFSPLSRYRIGLADNPHVVSILAGLLALTVAFLILTTDVRLRGEPVQFPYYVSALFAGLGAAWYCGSSAVVLARMLVDAESFEGQVLLSVTSAGVCMLARVLGSVSSAAVLVITALDGSPPYNCPVSTLNQSFALSASCGEASGAGTGAGGVVGSGCCMSVCGFDSGSCVLSHVYEWALSLLVVLSLAVALAVLYMFRMKGAYDNSNNIVQFPSRDDIEDLG